MTHSRYIKSSCSDYCPQRPHACTSWGQGGSLSPATGLCCAAGTGGVWVVKLYLVNMKAHLGYGGCLGGLRVGGALPTAALTLPCSRPLNMPCTSYPPTGLRLNSSFCLECPPPTALTGKLLLILVNCCFFQEAFLGPTRNVYRAPETLVVGFLLPDHILPGSPPAGRPWGQSSGPSTWQGLRTCLLVDEITLGPLGRSILPLAPPYWVV